MLNYKSLYKKIVFLVLLVGFLAVNPSFCQSSFLQVSELDDMSQSDTWNYFKWVYSEESDANFVKSLSFKTLNPNKENLFDRSHTTIWIKFSIKNNQSEAQKQFVSFGNHERITAYECMNGLCNLIGKTGHLILPKNRSIEHNESFLKLNLDPHELSNYLIRIESYRLSESRFIVPILLDAQAYTDSDNRHSKGLNHIILLFGFFIGSFIAFIIYPINLFLTSRKKHYLFYALHILAVIFSISLRSDIDLNFDILFCNFPRISFGLYHVCALFSIPFYTLFIIHILDLKHTRPKLYQFIRYILWLSVIVIVLSVIAGVVFQQYYLAHDLVLFGKVFSMIAGLVFFIILFRADRVSRYLAWGTLFLVIGAIITNLLRFYHVSALDNFNTSVLNWNLFYVHAGIFIEFIFFSLALSHNHHLIEKEKQAALHNWINQLEENKKFQENYKVELENEVATQTQNNINYRQEIEDHERNQLKASFNKKIVDLELKALRAQMNPHFMFNSMNSIKSLMQKGKDEKAVIYLTKFSKLLRGILNASNQTMHSLEEEMDICKLYLEIESLRFEDKFSVSLDIDPNIDMSFLNLPSLLLQPYLENALWHGLLHKQGERDLNVSVSKKGKYVKIIIKDNGVGREEASKAKLKKTNKHKSMGMQIGLDRIELYNKRREHKITVDIVDLFDSGDNALGTKVVVSIPYFD